MKATLFFLELLTRALVITGYEPFETDEAKAHFLEEATTAVDLSALARMLEARFEREQWLRTTVIRMTSGDMLVAGPSYPKDGSTEAKRAFFRINVKMAGDDHLLRVRLYHDGATTNSAIAECEISLASSMNAEERIVRASTPLRAREELRSFFDKAARAGRAIEGAMILSWFAEYNVHPEPAKASKKQVVLTSAPA